MRKRPNARQHGEEISPRGTWAKAFRDFYADEAKAIGMPVDEFLDMVGDRLEKSGQRPKDFRRELISQRWRNHSVCFSHWLER
jgi:hypothetical protein